LGFFQRDVNISRAALHIFVSATKTLLTHTITYPSNPLALADLKLIEPLLSLLCVLANGGMSDTIVETYRSCAELFENARMAVESSNSADMSWKSLDTGGEPKERESVEEFLKRMDDILTSD
jgi:hypothetical protein